MYGVEVQGLMERGVRQQGTPAQVIAAQRTAGSSRDSETDWNEWALRARQDPDLFDCLAGRLSSYIKRTAFRSIHHYVTESDEEWSVALLAFYEAVQSYRRERGSFLGFASMVIRRRLVDYERKSVRDENLICVPNETLDSQWEEGSVTRLDYEISTKAEEKSLAYSPEGTAVGDEIEALGQQLEEYGFGFFDLPDASPKAEKTRIACGKAVRAILDDEVLLFRMERKKSLPMKDLAAVSGVPRKVLDRHRRYIITAVLILQGDYPELTEYVRCLKQGGDKAEALRNSGTPAVVLCGLLMMLSL